jgi:hypothetical protein
VPRSPSPTATAAPTFRPVNGSVPVAWAVPAEEVVVVGPLGWDELVVAVAVVADEDCDEFDEMPVEVVAGGVDDDEEVGGGVAAVVVVSGSTYC